MKKNNKTISFNSVGKLKKRIEKNIAKLKSPNYLSDLNKKANNISLPISKTNKKKKYIKKKNIPEIKRKIKSKDLIGIYFLFYFI